MEAGAIIVAICLLAILLGLVTGRRSAMLSAEPAIRVDVFPCAIGCGCRVMIVGGMTFGQVPICHMCNLRLTEPDWINRDDIVALLQSRNACV